MPVPAHMLNLTFSKPQPTTPLRSASRASVSMAKHEPQGSGIFDGTCQSPTVLDSAYSGQASVTNLPDFSQKLEQWKALSDSAKIGTPRLSSDRTTSDHLQAREFNKAPINQAESRNQKGQCKQEKQEASKAHEASAYESINNLWSGTSRAVEPSYFERKFDTKTKNVVALTNRGTWSHETLMDSWGSHDLPEDPKFAAHEAHASYVVPAVSGNFVQAYFQGPDTSAVPRVSIAGDILPARTRDPESPALTKSRKPGLISDFISSHPFGDVINMRRELLHGAERSKGGKMKKADFADLPHIGHTVHAGLSLPLTGNSQLAAAAATAPTKKGSTLTRQVNSNLDKHLDVSMDITTKIDHTSSDSQGIDGQGKISDVNAPVEMGTPRDASQQLEWYCTRKYNKYALQRKSKLRLNVDECGRIRLFRRSPVLAPIDGSNVPQIPTQLDTYGTPAVTHMRDSHGWISSAMQSLKRHHSPPKTPQTRRDKSPVKVSLRGELDMPPLASPAPLQQEGCFSDEDDAFCNDSAPVPDAICNDAPMIPPQTEEKSPGKNGDPALRLGGVYVRHLLDVNKVTFKEKHDKSFRKDEVSSVVGGNTAYSRSKVVKEDMAKGKIMIKFKDGYRVELSGMQVRDVASDFQRRIDLWGIRRKNQAVSLEGLVQLAKTKVSWDNTLHRERLETFWNAVYVDTPMPEPSLNVNVSPGWKDIGFQSNDPCTDFRAMGLLGLHCLCYHSTKYPSRVRTIVHAGKPNRDFPYAAVGINLVASLVQVTLS